MSDRLLHHQGQSCRKISRMLHQQRATAATAARGKCDPSHGEMGDGCILCQVLGSTKSIHIYIYMYICINVIYIYV